MEGDGVFIPLTPVKPIPERPGFHIVDTVGGQYNGDSALTSTEGAGKVLGLNEAFTCIGSSTGLEYSTRTGLTESLESTDVQYDHKQDLDLAGMNPKGGVNVPTTAKHDTSYRNENVKVPPEDKKAHDVQKSQVGDGQVPSSSATKSNRKRRNDGIDLNKKPSQRPRVKKHRPKILDDSKPKKVPKTQTSRTSTPKPKTPKPVTPNRVHEERKYTRKKNFTGSKSDTRESVVQQVQTASKGSPVVAKSCRRSLEFDLQIINRDSQILPKSCEEPSSFNFDHGELDIFRKIKTSKRNTDRKSRFQKKNLEASEDLPGDANKELLTEDIKNRERDEKNARNIVNEQNFGLINKTECVRNYVRVYQRTFRVNECQKNSRKSGPNFPKMFKKRRTARRRATIFATWFCVKVSAKIALGRAKRATKKVKKSKFENKVVMKSIPYLEKRFLRVISSTKQQTTAAVRDPESSKCMSPVSKLRKKRLIGLTRRRENIVEFPLGKAMPCDNETNERFLQLEDSFLELPECLPSQEVPILGDGRKWLPREVVPVLKIRSSPPQDTKKYSNDLYVREMMNILIGKLENLDINGQCKELVVRDLNMNGALAKADPPKKRKVIPKVVLDDETLRVWKLLMENDGSESVEETDKNKEEWWERQREIFRGRVDSFIAKMHLIQGNRRFSAWKGSVVDSVVGVYLTQNVSDHLSSSAFMSLAATYPLKSKSKEVDDHGEVACIQESIGSNTGVDGRIFDNNETKQDMSNSCVDINDETPVTKAHQILEMVEENTENNGHMKNSESQFVVKQKSTSEDYSVCSLHSEVTNDTKEKTVNAETTPRKKKSKIEEKEEKAKIDWDELRRSYCKFEGKERNDNNMDAVDWEAVKGATVDEIAETIVERGMNNVLALRIKDFLERMVKDHGNIDLEWLRDVPPDKAKEFLLSIQGIGLKSVECVRLLTLQHLAFPVDTNVARVATRLGWVPLQPLPEELQIHLLNSYPMMDSIQKYLFPRLCNLDQPTLYELHYQLITFGKVFCTKRNPNCNACPMRAECRHYASAFASARFALPGSKERSTVTSIVPSTNTQPSASFQGTEILGSSYRNEHCEPIIEVPPSPEPEQEESTPTRDIEDYTCDSDDEIPTIRLDAEEFKESLRQIMDTNNLNLPEADMSKALVVLTNEATRIRPPPMKYVAKLRTAHLVYELPDSHQLLKGYDKREPDDPCPYLLAIWPKEKENSNSSNEFQEDTVKATTLIPCRTANRGRFPLNGTYFQVNEVFADHETSQNPIDVPRKWIWNLNRRGLGCATSATSLFRGLSTNEIQRCFWNGFMCVRGYERSTRRPQPLHSRFHLSTTAVALEKAKTSSKLGKK